MTGRRPGGLVCTTGDSWCVPCLPCPHLLGLLLALAHHFVEFCKATPAWPWGNGEHESSAPPELLGEPRCTLAPAPIVLHHFLGTQPLAVGSRGSAERLVEKGQCLRPLCGEDFGATDLATLPVLQRALLWEVTGASGHAGSPSQVTSQPRHFSSGPLPLFPSPSPLPHAGPAWLGQLPEDAAEMLGVFQPQEADGDQTVKLWSAQKGCSDARGGLPWP